MDPIQRIVEYFLKLRKHMAHRRKALTVAAAVVVFAVAYALTLPAITLDRDTASQESGISIGQVADNTGGGDAAGSADEQAQAMDGSGDEATQSDGQSGDDAAEAGDVESDEQGVADAEEAGPSASQETNTVTGEPAQQAAEESQQESEPEKGDESQDADDKQEDPDKLEASSLQSGIELQASEVDAQDDKDSYETYVEKSLAKIQESQPEVKAFGSAHFFDARFVDASGNETEPSGKVDFTVQFEDFIAAETDGDVKVVRIRKGDGDDVRVTVLDDGDVTANVSDGLTDKVGFKASGAAVYGVVTLETSAETEDAGKSQASESENSGSQESAGNKTEQKQSTPRTLTVQNDSYKVTLTYDESAGLPEGARLQVSNVPSDSDDYATAKEAVVAAKKAEDEGFDEDRLGLAAVDVSILDADGNEVEPTGTVQVSIEASGLPEAAADSGVDVQHIVGEGDNPVAQTVANGVSVDDGSAVAEFDVDGFSVFTITWSVKNGESLTRVANVKIHYVDENGSSLQDPTQIPDTSSDKSFLTSGDPVDLKTWAEDSGVSKISGYTYDHAVIGARDGETITGLKATEDTSSQSRSSKTYKLYYTQQENVATVTSWTVYKDDNTGGETNNADIYLVYKANEATPDPTGVTFHHVDIYGAQLASDTTAVYWFNNVNQTYLGKWNGSSGALNSTSTAIPARVSGVGTFQYTYIGVFGSNQTTSNVLAYKKDSDGTWHTGTGNNANNPSQEIKAGTGEDAQPVAYTDIYQVYSGYKGVTIHYVDADGNELQAKGGSAVSSGGVFKASASEINGYTFASAHIGSKDGSEFTSVTYTQSGDTWASEIKNGDSTVSSDLVNDVYYVYTPLTSTTVTVHHVNLSGETIHEDTTVDETSGAELTPSSASATIANYSMDHSYFKNGSAYTTFSSITYTESGGSWSSVYKTSASDTTGTSLNYAISEVYVVYEKSTLAGGVTFHHVDTEGVELAASQTVSMGADSVYINEWNGRSNTLSSTTSTGIGTYLKTYVGYFGDENYTNEYTTDNRLTALYTGLSYYHDTTNNVWRTSTTNDAHNQSAVHKEYHPKGSNTGSVFLTDIYQVYGGSDAKKGVIIHHVDTAGNKLTDDTRAILSSEGTLTAKDQAVDCGYAYKEAHYGSSNVTGFTSLSYTYDTSINHWSSTYTDEADTTAATSDVVNEVWLVYDTSKPTKTFTVHYVYFGDGGEVKEDTNQSSQTFLISASDNAKFIGPDSTENENSFTHNKTVTTSSGDSVSSLTYASTHVGNANGPQYNWVKVNSDGTITYMYDNGSNTASYDLNLQSSGVWRHAEGSRTLTLRKDNSSGDFTLNDSEFSDVQVNMTSEPKSGETTTPTYKGTYRDDNQTVEYTLNPEGSANSDGVYEQYKLTVQSSMKSSSQDIYFVYTDSNGSGLSIDDELVKNGRLTAQVSDTLKSTLSSEGVSNVSYTWYKISTDTSETLDTVSESVNNGVVVGDEVIRNQAGTDWNIAYAPADRTWLDVAADDGYRTTSSKTFYRVELSYTDASGKSYTLKSAPVEIPYYNQLENGSFETPYILQRNEDGSLFRDANGNLVQINGFGWQSDTKTGAGNQTSLSNYQKNGGIWKTTGLGITSNHPDQDIEIFNVKQGHTGLAQYWKNGSSGNADTDTISADDGDQFAELNCETAGALYQDVITHPNTSLNYWLSHRSRLMRGGNQTYDSMYLVIMPTREALESGDNGGELDTQAELVNYINAHGGYSNSNPGGEESEVIYENKEKGILIRKISSDNFNWHNVTEYNGYTATASVTRFFFVAGYTGNNNNTLGNFLDNVGFSQQLPPVSNGFNLTVTKTFRGLYSSQVAALASNAQNVNGQKLGESTKRNGDSYDSFKITLGNTNESDGTANSALNNAVLEFSASGSGGTYEYTLSAKDKDGNSLINPGSDDEHIKQNSVTSRTNSDGSVTMTWTFANQAMDDINATYDYTATESGELLSGLTVDTSVSASPAAESNTQASAISKSDDGTIDLTNSYQQPNNNEQPEITVSKTFSGVTPTTVQSLWSNGYKLTVTKAVGEGQTAPSANLSIYSDQLSASAKLVSTTENVDGSMTYVWTVTGSDWTDGTYTIRESGLKSDKNTLSRVTVVGTEDKAGTVPSDLNNTSIITISGNTVASKSTKELLDWHESENSSINRKQSGPASGDSLNPSYSLGSSTNVIIAQYENTTFSGDNVVQSGNDKHYVVWTSIPLGRKTSSAILAKIQSEFKDTSTIAELYNRTTFRSGSNPGVIAPDSTASGFSLSYDSSATTNNLMFKNVNPTTTSEGGTTTTTEGRRWTKFYSTHYSVANSSPETYDDNDLKVENLYNAAVKGRKISSESTDDDTILLSGAAFRLFKEKTTTSGEGEEKTTTTTTTYYKYDSSNTSAPVSWVTDDKDGTLLYTGPDGAFYTTQVYWLGDYIAGSTTLYNKPVAHGNNDATVYIADSNGKATSTAVTDSDKAVEAPLSSLEAAQYYLEEVTAPDGYNKLTKKISFTVNSNLSVTLDQMAKKDTDNNEVKNENGETVMVPLVSDTVDNSVASIDWQSPYYTITLKNEPGKPLPLTGGSGTAFFTVVGLALILADVAVVYCKRRSRNRGRRA